MEEGMGLPAIPEDIDPNAPIVAFELLQCRTCQQHSGWHLVAEQHIGVGAYNWQESHTRETPHRDYYRFKAERGTSRMYL